MDFLVDRLLFFQCKEPLYLNIAATRQIFPPCFLDERQCHLVIKPDIRFILVASLPGSCVPSVLP